MKLFIIGNGFDRATGYETSYSNFKDYLTEKGAKYSISGFSLIELLSEDDFDLWKDFEENLANLSFKNLFRKCDGVEKNKKIKEVLNDICTNLYTVLGNAFSDFIESATRDIKPANQLFKPLFGPDDKFITFNYSQTLEKVYFVNNESVFYIHGTLLPDRRIDENNESIIYGHSGDIPINKEENSINYELSDFEVLRNNIRKSLEKTLEIIDFEAFVGSLADYEEIHIIGHSLGIVDEPYFLKLNTKYTPTIVYWEYTKSESFNRNKTIQRVKNLFPKLKCLINLYDETKIEETINLFSEC